MHARTYVERLRERSQLADLTTRSSAVQRAHTSANPNAHCPGRSAASSSTILCWLNCSKCSHYTHAHTHTSTHAHTHTHTQICVNAPLLTKMILHKILFISGSRPSSSHLLPCLCLDFASPVPHLSTRWCGNARAEPQHTKAHTAPTP